MGCAPSTAPNVQQSFFDSYILGAKLGRGNFAQVRTAKPVLATTKRRTKKEKKEFAVKIIDLRDGEAPGTLRKTLYNAASSEAMLWMKANNHENVVKLHCVFYERSFCYLVMEKCAMSLFEHLEDLVVLNERSLAKILSQMLLGLNHLHSAGVVHRDVKPENFLVSSFFAATVKICDLGMSAFLPDSGTTKLKGVYGTAPFMCPEMVKGNYYDEKADLWSLGVLAYTLLFGEFPYSAEVPTSKYMLLAIVDGNAPTFDPVAPCMGQKRSDNAVGFVKSLLTRSPENRPFALDALQMTYMMAARQGAREKWQSSEKEESEGPCLRPMLYAARQAGAFDRQNVSNEADIDRLLNSQQQLVHGGPSLIEHDYRNSLERMEISKTYNHWRAIKSSMSRDSMSTASTTASTNFSLGGSAVASVCSSSASCSRMDFQATSRA